MKLIGCGVAFALAISTVAIAQQGTAQSKAQKSGEGKQVNLTGCVVKGDNGYVLTRATNTGSGAMGSGATGSGAAGAGATGSGAMGAGSRGAGGHTYYALGNDAAVAQHAGERVEIVAEIASDVPPDQIAIRRVPEGMALEFGVGPEKIAVVVPDTPVGTSGAATGTSGSTGTMKPMTDREKRDVHVKNVDVKSVKQVAGDCK
jgi:hypothetical protein